LASRIGQEQARVAAMLLLTLRGTPTLYYGDEIGMQQVSIAPDQVRDPFEKNVPGIGVGRDGCRTPMQWDATDHGGFSTSSPWLPLAHNFRHRNVANLDADPNSILNLHKALMALRRNSPSLMSGDYIPMAAEGDLLLFRRLDRGEEAMVVALNLGNEPISVASASLELEGNVLLSTFLDRLGEKIHGVVDLRANEGIIIEQAPSD
jgi:alpha-glucosidase